VNRGGGFYFNMESLTRWTRSEINGSALEFRVLNLKFQYSMAKTFRDETLFGFSNFGHAQRRRLRRVLEIV